MPILKWCVAWLMLDGAVIADEKLKAVDKAHPDAAFYGGKVQAALYYARSVLPAVELKAKQMLEEDRSPLDISDAGFASV